MRLTRELEARLNSREWGFSPAFFNGKETKY